MLRSVVSWLKEEDGFQVFESLGLVKGGLIVAVGVISIFLVILGVEYTRMENEFIGNEAEANEALQKFSQ
ncbi:hypothetical protein [Salibacterium aidingense]|uniref:hypothetical protein n=1 Tax=Salibacterium aidingense TaxID=384933 RepID=UPI000420D84D|nr:hypothetical protein [Salibacterium aidingense]